MTTFKKTITTTTTTEEIVLDVSQDSGSYIQGSINEKIDEETGGIQSKIAKTGDMPIEDHLEVQSTHTSKHNKSMGDVYSEVINNPIYLILFFLAAPTTLVYWVSAKTCDLLTGWHWTLHPLTLSGILIFCYLIYLASKYIKVKYRNKRK